MAFASSIIRPAVRPLLGLPPALRQSLYQQQHGVRQFSLSGITGAMDASGVVALFPATAMETLHAVGLPWYAVFPMSAVLIRSLFVFPLFQKPLRTRATERITLQPIVDANMSVMRRNLVKKHMSPVQERWKMILGRWTLNRHYSRYIFRHPRLSIQRGLSFFTLIAVSDSIRRLCGHKEGLLKLLLGPLDWTLSWIIPSSIDAAAPKEPVSQSVQPPPSSPAAISSGEDLQSLHDPAHETLSNHHDTVPEWNAADTVASDPAPFEPVAHGAAESVTQANSPSLPLATDSPWFEPSLLTDGMSWCPDLTAADPTLVLPVLFSTSFFASIYFSPRIGGERGGKATNLQRIVMTIAMLSIIPALKMPVALLLYFISNIWVSALQTRWLSYTVPGKPVPLACKRPVRTQPMKEMVDDATEMSARRRR